MSANQSNLSSTGFDYVVAVTQDSINATLEHYLYYSGLPEVILCYAYDKDNQPQPIDFATFLKQANNIDPFSIQNGTASGDARVQAVSKANFAFAIKAKLGLPPGVAPAKLPPIVALKPGQSNVTYTLLFAEFVAAEIIYGPRGSMTWFKQCQPAGTSWTFSGAVDLDFQTAEFAKLPPAIQQKLKDLGNPSTFSVQQLYYDLNSSNLEQGFQFNNVPSNSILNTFMTANFIDTYWRVLKASGSGTILGYGAKQLASPSFLSVTDLNFFVPEVVGNSGPPLMLNYLCATNNHQLPSTTHAGFGWNWLNDGKQYHGAAAINRNTLARYLNDKLYRELTGHCYRPTVSLEDTYTTGLRPAFSGEKYIWNMASGQAPAVTYPPSGSTILSYKHQLDAHAEQPYRAFLFGPYGIKLATTFEAQVSVQGSQLVVVQHLVIALDVWNGANEGKGNIVDRMITDTFTISADSHGRIVLSAPASVPVDNSQDPSVNAFLNFWAPVNQIISDIKQWSLGSATSLSDIKLSDLQDFVFPGGAVFSSMDAAFSDYQDLVSHFTYANPS